MRRPSGIRAAILGEARPFCCQVATAVVPARWMNSDVELTRFTPIG